MRKQEHDGHSTRNVGIRATASGAPSNAAHGVDCRRPRAKPTLVATAQPTQWPFPRAERCAARPAETSPERSPAVPRTPMQQPPERDGRARRQPDREVRSLGSNSQCARCRRPRPCPASTSRSARPARRSGARGGDIRRSPLRAPRGRNPANRSARKPARYRPPATAGNSTAAARRWCG